MPKIFRYDFNNQITLTVKTLLVYKRICLEVFMVFCTSLFRPTYKPNIQIVLTVFGTR